MILKSGFRYALVLVLIISLVVMPGIALAGWSGSQTVTWELHNELRTIYTSVLNYEATEWLHVTLVMDRHPVLGTDLDLSTTLYVPFRDILYATVGVRRGLFNSGTGYVSVTVRF